VFSCFQKRTLLIWYKKDIIIDLHYHLLKLETMNGIATTDMMISVCNSIIINQQIWIDICKEAFFRCNFCDNKSNHEIRWYILKPKWPLYPQKKHIQTMISVCISFFNANTTNCRTLVQLFTGCPTTAITLNFWQLQHLMQDRYQSQVVFFQLAWRSLIMVCRWIMIYIWMFCPMFYICCDWLFTPFSGLFTHSSLHTLSLTSHFHYPIFHPLFSLTLLSLYLKLLKSP